MALRDVVRAEAERHHGTVTYSNDMYEAYVPRDIEAIKNMKMYVHVAMSHCFIDRI